MLRGKISGAQSRAEGSKETKLAETQWASYQARYEWIYLARYLAWIKFLKSEANSIGSIWEAAVGDQWVTAKRIFEQSLRKEKYLQIFQSEKAYSSRQVYPEGPDWFVKSDHSKTNIERLACSWLWRVTLKATFLLQQWGHIYVQPVQTQMQRPMLGHKMIDRYIFIISLKILPWRNWGKKKKRKRQRLFGGWGRKRDYRKSGILYFKCLVPIEACTIWLKTWASKAKSSALTSYFRIIECLAIYSNTLDFSECLKTYRSSNNPRLLATDTARKIK